MHRPQLRIIVAIILSLPVAVLAGDGTYVRGELSRFMPDTTSGGFVTSGAPATVLDVELDDGERFSFAAGQRISDIWRLELELTRQLDTPVDSSIRVIDGVTDSISNFRMYTEYASSQLMVNNYLDFGRADVDSKWRPFIGLGLGAARNSTDDLTFDLNTGSADTVAGDTTTEFAWKLTAGTGYQLSPGTRLEASLSYLDAGELTSGKASRNSSARLDEPVTLDLRGWVFGVGVSRAF